MLGSNDMAFCRVNAHGADQLAHATKACATLCLALSRSEDWTAQGNFNEQRQEAMQPMYSR